MIADNEFSALWDKYSDRIFSFIQGKVESREEAEDLLQEVFIRVHTGLCCFHEWELMERWIYRVTRNLIVDHYRASRPSEEYRDLAESSYASPDVAEDPLASLAFSLKEMIGKLPEPYREALLLSEYEGLSRAELAARLGISLPAAKSRVQRARERLKDLLLECCHFELDRLGGIIDYGERCGQCDLLRKAAVT